MRNDCQAERMLNPQRGRERQRERDREKDNRYRERTRGKQTVKNGCESEAGVPLRLRLRVAKG